MTLTYAVNLDILHEEHRRIPEMKIFGQDFQELEHEQDRQRQIHIETGATERITTVSFACGNNQ